ncbi:hypothetical protein LGT41_0013585 [Abyssibius alkaniclasticus]|uniref:hypothetical protein n=1 Tax=Abyssibius alkaniclasticus TaxID=2881234 RepID=UPI002363E2BA|nr:hypothetical protein [Abyssibius alkaniclasticus]UPH70805.1 hypothetical protein LGT41_0013585 [Abyssibius alkaniclasticus]
MTKQSPTLALDLSGDAASLQQLAFDGHWHEMARAGFNDNGLAEKMAFMRRVAVRLEGRRFHNTVWLPDAQIIERKLKIAATEAEARRAEARTALATITTHPADDFLVELGATDENGFTPTFAVRKTTLSEARRFATSHGFKAEQFSMNRVPEGFDDRIYFKAPADPKAALQTAAKAAAVVLAVGLALGGAYWADPFGWRSPASPDALADLAPAPEAPAQAEAVPAVVAEQTTAPEPAPAPERAVASSPEPEAPGTDIAEVAPVLLADQAAQTDAGPVEPALAVAEAPATPALDPLATQSQTAELPPVADIADTGEAPVDLAQADAAPPEPAQAELVARAETPEVAPLVAPSDLAEAATVESPAPDESAPAEIVVAREAASNILDDLAAATPLPDPVVRVPDAAQPAPAEGAAAAELAAQEQNYEIISGLPDFALLLRSGATAPTPIEIGTIETIIAASVAADAGPRSEPQPEDVAVVTGRPAFIPLLRARPAPEAADDTETAEGAEAETETAAVAEDGAASPASPIALEEAQRLRPARRPEAFALAAVATDDIISGAAPRTASRASHRSADFAARIAPLVNARATSATTSSPAIPAEPQSVALPTRASVARAATIENAINLREVALIGIYGTADSRRALVRLASGRYIRLTLGESFSGGWRIIAMDDISIRVQKGSRTEILRISG